MSGEGVLAGRVAVITGAAVGIGRATALLFAREGALVVAVDLDRASLESLAAEAGGAIMPKVLDVTDGPGIVALFAELKAAGKLVTVLMNNAAARSPPADVVDLPEAEWHKALAVNLTSAFLFSKQAVAHMREAGRGSVIHVASQLGSVSTYGRFCYSATKGALIAMAKGMALDHAKENIRVNTLSPGAVRTPRLTNLYKTQEALDAHFIPLHPIGRVGEAEEIADAALFLACDRSSFMTGSDLIVDGGYTAK
jgi:NAD(P)-dependent dehydrogenase (short-subunit alcohol dehydrogenase family)